MSTGPATESCICSDEDQSKDTVALRKLNNKIAGDCRVMAVQMNVGDGLTLCTKI